MRARGGRRLWPRVVGAVVVLLFIVAVAAYWYVRPLLLTATGYAAHNQCAIGFLTLRGDPERDLPSNPLVPYLRSGVDDGRVRATILNIFAPQTAYAQEYYGCTVTGSELDLPEATRVAGNDFLDQPAVSASPDLASAIARAFGDDLDAEARAALGTRAVVVLHDGRLVGERYTEGFDESTRQLGWSMAKSATNLLVGRLVHQGVVDIDAPVDMDWADEESSTITINHLLRMRSGLEWDETYDIGTPITAMLYLEPDMGAFAARQRQEHPVGTVGEYSSGSTNIVCNALARASGEGADLPRKQLFAPLGLTRAVWEVDASGVPVCSSYLWATPREFGLLGQFALDDGVIDGELLLPEGWMEAATTAEPLQEAEDPNYGSGWWVNRRPDGTLTHPSLPPDTFWMQGHDGQRVFVVPSEGLVVVRMGFSPDAPDLRVEQLVADVIATLG